MTREDVFKVVQGLAKEKDLFAASEYVLGLGDESKVVEAFSKLILDCHHKAKSRCCKVIFWFTASVVFQRIRLPVC